MKKSAVKGKEVNPEERLENRSLFIDALSKSMPTTPVYIGNESSIKNITKVPTGLYSYDRAIGGGLPVGRIIELYGWESSGKSTIALLHAAATQRDGGVVLFIDVEHALNRQWATLLGVDVDAMLIIQPDTAEDALMTAELAVKNNAANLIILDSVAAMLPKSELEGDMGDNKMGVHARLMSQGLRKLTAILHHSDTTMIFINQFREKIGVMFGDPRTTSGGNSLKFYASIRVEVKKSTLIKKDGEVIGNLIITDIKKNKTSPPFKAATFEVLYESGINIFKDKVEALVALDIIQKSGSWYAYNEIKIGQGIDAVVTLLADNPELTEELTNQLPTD
jgi:recombination protein RecA